MSITQKLLKERFTYKNGNLFYKYATGRAAAGDIAGTKVGNYISVRIKGKAYGLHRLIFLYHHGYLPEQIDHKDGDTFNNLIGNLRAATYSTNSMNSKVRKNNTSGFKGVSYCRWTGRWLAQIVKDGKNFFLGRFDTPEEAAAVVKQERRILHGVFDRDESKQLVGIK